MRIYSSEHNERWQGFAHRSGDVVVSTRSKCGTTWLQAICVMLVNGGPDLPESLSQTSPWLDWEVESLEVVRSRLEAQDHRRVIKTHTPLDGLPLDDRVTYVVGARHPLDVAVSLFHHGRNIDRGRVAELTGNPPAEGPGEDLHEWLSWWVEPGAEPVDELDTLPGLLHHVADAWARRDHEGVVLVHVADLLTDTGAEVRRLADLLGVAATEEVLGAITRAVHFDAMRRQADVLAPDHLGVLRDRTAFFRTGGAGEWRSLLTEEELTRYRNCVRDRLETDALTWLERP